MNAWIDAQRSCNMQSWSESGSSSIRSTCLVQAIKNEKKTKLCNSNILPSFIFMNDHYSMRMQKKLKEMKNCTLWRRRNPRNPLGIILWINCIFTENCLHFFSLKMDSDDRPVLCFKLRFQLFRYSIWPCEK